MIENERQAGKERKGDSEGEYIGGGKKVKEREKHETKGKRGKGNKERQKENVRVW